MEEQGPHLLKGSPPVTDLVLFIAAELRESPSIWELEDWVIAETSVTARGERDLSFEGTLREVTALSAPDPWGESTLGMTRRSERIRGMELKL